MEVGLALLVFTFVAGLHYRPLWQERLGTSLFGTHSWAPDNILALGILEWGNVAVRQLSDPFEWPPGYPETNTLAGTEHLLGWQWLYIPLRWAGAGPVKSYNVAALVSLLIAALGATCLARTLGASAVGGVLAGLVYGFGPLQLWQAVQFSNLATCWIPYSLLAATALARRPSVLASCGLAAVWILTGMSGMYYGVLLGVMLPVYCVSLHVTRAAPIGPRACGALAFSVGLVAVAALPIWLHYLEFATEHSYLHAREYYVAVSATLSDYLFPGRWAAVFANTPLASAERYAPAFPGFTAALICLAALFEARARQYLRVAVISTLILTAAAALVLSLGPVFRISPDLSFPSLPMPGEVFVWSRAVRVPSRLIPFYVLCAAILAGLAATALLASRKPTLRLLGGCAFCLAVVVEYWPSAAVFDRQVTLNAPLDSFDGYKHVATLQSPGAIVELPVPATGNERNLTLARHVYGAAGHGRRTTSYYASVEFASSEQLRQQALRLPEPAACDALQRAGIGWVLVHTAAGSNSAEQLRRLEQRYQVVWSAEDGFLVALDRCR